MNKPMQHAGSVSGAFGRVLPDDLFKRLVQISKRTHLIKHRGTEAQSSISLKINYLSLCTSVPLC